MTEVDIAPRFGAELKDGFKPVNAWVSNGVTWLDDIQQFYRERAAIEKEYSTKLKGLANKNFEKKAKRASSLSVGDTPTLTPGASMTTWTTLLSVLESRAAEHDRYSSELILQVADPLKNLATRYEELRKSHVEYAAKLERERDTSYGEMKKTKGRYDGACQEVENRRKKTESSFDHGKGRAQNAYQQQVIEMHNVKEPLDLTFEPSPVWLDDSAMATDETAKIYLRNVLSRSKGQLRELKQEVDKRKKEVENIKQCPGEQSKEERKKLKVERQAASKAAPPQTNGAPHDGATELPALSRSNTMDTLSSGYAASANRSVTGRLQTEEASTDGDSVNQPPTNKPATLRKNRIVAPPPTQYVSELPTHAPSGSRSSTSHPAEVKGKMNYAYNAQADGEVSVEEGEEVIIVEPDDGGWTSVKLDSHSTGLVPTSYIEFLTTPAPPERPISSYSSSSASLAGSIPGKKKGPAVAPKRGAKKLKYVEALYDYEARSDMEWSMSEGEKFVLITKDTGDGWADVEKGGVTKSVPANYVHEV
ncbi:hypothetical protein P7C71_g2980, partial [Lecanoromycetidae sp. Uapishka_2]